MIHLIIITQCHTCIILSLFCVLVLCSKAVLFVVLMIQRMLFVFVLCRHMKVSLARHVLGQMMEVTLPGATTGARLLSLARTASSKHSVVRSGTETDLVMAAHLVVVIVLLLLDLVEVTVFKNA